MAKKLYVAHDADGRIISASDTTSKLPLPEKMEGIKTAEFEVPSKFENRKAREYVHLLSVDVNGAQLKEK